jgi:hypothetical protein
VRNLAVFGDKTLLEVFEQNYFFLSHNIGVLWDTRLNKEFENVALVFFPFQATPKEKVLTMGPILSLTTVTR